MAAWKTKQKTAFSLQCANACAVDSLRWIAISGNGTWKHAEWIINRLLRAECNPK